MCQNLENCEMVLDFWINFLSGSWDVYGTLEKKFKYFVENIFSNEIFVTG